MNKPSPSGESGVRRGEDHPHVAYTDGEVDTVRELRDAGWSYGDIARKMDMPRSTVSDICLGRRR